MSATIQAKVLYPLSALVAVNTRQMLFRQKVLMPFIAVLVPLMIVVLMRVVQFLYPETMDSEMQDTTFVYSMLCAGFYMQFLIWLLALLKGIAVFSEEVDDGTLIYLFLRPVPRSVLVSGKFLAYWVTVSALLTFSLVLCFLLLGTAPGSDMLRYDWDLLIKDLWVLSLGLGAYGSILMLIGVLFKRSLGLGIVFFLWDAVASYIPGSAYRFTVKHYLQSIFPHEQINRELADFFGQHPPTPQWLSVLSLLGIIIASILLTTVAIKYRQVGEIKNTEL